MNNLSTKTILNLIAIPTILVGIVILIGIGWLHWLALPVVALACYPLAKQVWSEVNEEDPEKVLTKALKEIGFEFVDEDIWGPNLNNQIRGRFMGRCFRIDIDAQNSALNIYSGLRFDIYIRYDDDVYLEYLFQAINHINIKHPECKMIFQEDPDPERYYGHPFHPWRTLAIKGYTFMPENHRLAEHLKKLFEGMARCEHDFAQIWDFFFSRITDDTFWKNAVRKKYVQPNTKKDEYYEEDEYYEGDEEVDVEDEEDDDDDLPLRIYAWELN